MEFGVLWFQALEENVKMKEQQNKHYSAESLTQFLSGLLGGEDALQIESHLENCPQCSSILEAASLSQDQLIQRLRNSTSKRPQNQPSTAAKNPMHGP
jgi:hypothetical protein